jgi:putative transposase
MPDHVHTVLRGTVPGSDLWKTMSLFKQFTGYWLSRNRPGMRWQGDFFDHLIRDDEELKRHLRNIAENPVRRGLVDDWRTYPFLGSDVCDLRGLLDPA